MRGSCERSGQIEQREEQAGEREARAEVAVGKAAERGDCGGGALRREQRDQPEGPTGDEHGHERPRVTRPAEHRPRAHGDDRMRDGEKGEECGLGAER